MNTKALREQVAQFDDVVEDQLDFSNEPVFDDDSEPVRYDLPGLAESYIRVKRTVPYQIYAGRSNFATNRQRFENDTKGKKRAADTIEINYDIYGLSVYKVRNCLTEIQLKDPKTGKLQRATTSSSMEMIFKAIKSEKISTWIIEQIDKTLGWDKEGEEEEKSFPGTVEGDNVSTVAS